MRDDSTARDSAATDDTPKTVEPRRNGKQFDVEKMAADRKAAKRILRGYARELARTPSGGRDDDVIRCAYNAGKLVNMNLLGRAEVHSELRPAIALWGDYDDGLAQDKIDRTLDDAASQGAVWHGELVSHPTQSTNGNVAGKAAESDDSDEFADATPVLKDDTPVLKPKLLTRSDLRNLPDPEPLIDNVLDQGTTALLYGKWGTAKTFIALDWAASVATGRAWFDRKTVQRKVLYVVGEGAFGFKGRVDAWETGWATYISDEWLAILPEPVNLTNPAQVNNLRALIDWDGYDFVILDTLARCMVGADENSAKDCGIVVDSMTKLLQATPKGHGVILGVHHAGKDGTTLRGSSAFEGGSDTVYFSGRDDDGGWISLTREKRKDGPEHDHHVLKIDPMPGTTSAVLCAGREQDKPARDVQPAFDVMELAEIVHRVINEQPEHSVASLNKTYAAMRLAGHAFRNTSIADAVDVLVLSGRLVEVPGKRNAIGYQSSDDRKEFDR